MERNPQKRVLRVKKIATDVDKCPGFSEKRYQMICQIQMFLKDGCSYREIAKRMGVGRNTIAKYREGDPKELSMYGMRQSKLDPFYDCIMECLNSGWSKSKTVKEIYARGYDGSVSNAFEHLAKIEAKEKRSFAEQPYLRTMTEGMKYKTGSVGKEKDYITREGIFRYVWKDTEIAGYQEEYLRENYPEIFQIRNCVREFRNIFNKHNVPLLYLFIEKYKNGSMKSINSFAKGLERDIDAVENAVAYNFSNGFVEGTNSRLKMLKRTMYGRCGMKLLEAKLRYIKINRNG